MIYNYLITTALIIIMASWCVEAFVPAPRLISVMGPASLLMPPSNPIIAQKEYNNHYYYIPAALQHQRKSVASVQTMGLFGLGAPEIGVILVAAAFLLGPQKLAELGKDAGKIAGELKEVPKEFQKGLEEGEKQAKLMKAESSAAP